MRLGADADATEDEGLVDDLLCIVEEFLTTFDPFVFFLYFLVSSLTAQMRSQYVDWMMIVVRYTIPY
jgi:hypothetical protein